MKLLLLDFIPRGTDLGLLVLRVWLGLTMAIQHGLPKLKNFEAYSAKFPGLFGLEPKVALGLATFAELGCSCLLVLGLLTRLAALNLVATMAVAFFVAHQMRLIDDPTDAMKKSGELAFIYLAGFTALFFAGAGKFSVDSKLGAR